MADDNTLRSYRDPSMRTSHADPHANVPAADPLAELARLIGQTDPFADTARRMPQSAKPATAPHMAHTAPADDWRQHIERPNYGSMREELAPPADPYYSQDQYRNDSQGQMTAYPGEQSFEHEAAMFSGHPGGPHAAAMEPVYAGEHVVEQGYDDPPDRQYRARRGGVLGTAVLLVCCAMIGSAGAYGYRYLAKPSAGPKQAPVIVADKSPSKVVPAVPEQKSTRSQERFGEAGSERLVSREEQPVSLPAAAPVPPVPAAAPPPTAAPPAPPPAAAAPPPPSATASVPPSTDPNQPRRIRTVPIRPDGGDRSARPTTGDAGLPRALPPRPAPTTRTAGPPPTPPAPRVTQSTPPTARGAPLSLDPSAQASEPARPVQRALTPPAPRENARAANNPRLAAAPSNGGTGGYLVQVSSQRSESDAQASYRGLQAKYPQLRSRQALIRRADLGSKGVYYRAMVGPFSSAGEADQFCSGLKRAGGQCIILRN